MTWLIDYDNIGNYDSNLEIVRCKDELKNIIKNYKKLEELEFAENLVVYKLSESLSNEEINQLLEGKDD